ncbi:hypothetical protein LUZ60_013492 [Juncus effusus]|nr:hypothetical protein LUZ60_013492 [Juncus effusus]
MAGSNADQTYDLISLLSGNERDFLVKNNGDQVKISDLKSKIIGLYFSASWCGPCRNFTPKLIETYYDLSQSKPFEVIFISSDNDDESFKSYFSKMPWLAIPFSDSETRNKLSETFKIIGIPTLAVIEGQNGNLVTDDGVGAVMEHGSGAYPFTHERLVELKEEEENAKRNQTIMSVLANDGRDYLVSNKGDKVPVSDLEGKYVFLYFSITGDDDFTSTLSQIYEKLRQKGENFEVVQILLEKKESTFNQTLQKVPFLAIPFKDKSIAKLTRYFELRMPPTLVLIGTDGKTSNPNLSEIIEEHGVEAWEGYPFTEEKLGFLEEKARAKRELQTLESLLVNNDLDYVVGKDGTKVPVLDLVGKTILLYFSAKWCGPCRAFLPKLIEEYQKIKSQNSNSFEIIFISSDRDQDSYNDFFSSMPWLALPLGDPRKKFLNKTFKIRGIPSLVAIGPNGKTVSTDVKKLFMVYGAEAYPFNDERITVLKEEMEKMVQNWPKKLKNKLHEEHELVLTRLTMYGCDGCEKAGYDWSYRCVECDFDLHPKCALKEGNGEDNGEKVGKEGYVCDGDVCRKV